jgi:SAM-dependent methyltransferase
MSSLGLVAVLVGLALVARYVAGVGLAAPFLPIKRSYLADAMALADVTSADVVFDLGSGDGRILLAAAERGAEVHGVEINPVLVWLTRHRLRPFGARAEVKTGDLFQTSLAGATKVFLFCLGPAMPKIAAQIRRTQTRDVDVYSFAFQMPGVEPMGRRGIVWRYRFPVDNLDGVTR